MAWRVTRQRSVDFNDSKGTLGGFARGTTDEDTTAITVFSPNGTRYYIVVSDAGVLTAQTSLP